MKWSNHIALTGALVYGITGDIFAAMLSGSSAIIPDAIEGKTFNRRAHRKTSHWFVPYMALLILAAGYIAFFSSGIPDLSSFFLSGSPVDPLLAVAVFCHFMAIGSLLHICEDALCGKVPLFHPGKRIAGVKLFYTGSRREYLLTVLVVFFVIVVKYLQRGILS